jgi:hypothetical protein
MFFIELPSYLPVRAAVLAMRAALGKDYPIGLN